MPLLFFCLCNPKACPILAVSGAGDPRAPLPGAAIYIRTMLPRRRSASFSRLPCSSLPSRAGRGQLVGRAQAEGVKGWSRHHLVPAIQRFGSKQRSMFENQVGGDRGQIHRF